jgi:hypothetical protein
MKPTDHYRKRIQEGHPMTPAEQHEMLNEIDRLRELERRRNCDEVGSIMDRAINGMNDHG